MCADIMLSLLLLLPRLSPSFSSLLHPDQTSQIFTQFSALVAFQSPTRALTTKIKMRHQSGHYMNMIQTRTLTFVKGAPATQIIMMSAAAEECQRIANLIAEKAIVPKVTSSTENAVASTSTDAVASDVAATSTAVNCANDGIHIDSKEERDVLCQLELADAIGHDTVDTLPSVIARRIEWTKACIRELHVMWHRILHGKNQAYKEYHSKDSDPASPLQHFTHLLYSYMFKRMPELKSLFKKSMHQQGEIVGRVVHLLIEKVANHQFESATKMLQKIARFHNAYGITVPMYVTFCEALAGVLSELLGEDFSGETVTAATTFLGQIVHDILPIAVARTQPDQADFSKLDFILENPAHVVRWQKMCPILKESAGTGTGTGSNVNQTQSL
jgi:hemoglobin-like flavoprotein